MTSLEHDIWEDFTDGVFYRDLINVSSVTVRLENWGWNSVWILAYANASTVTVKWARINAKTALWTLPYLSTMYSNSKMGLDRGRNSVMNCGSVPIYKLQPISYMSYMIHVICHTCHIWYMSYTIHVLYKAKLSSLYLAN